MFVRPLNVIQKAGGFCGSCLIKLHNNVRFLLELLDYIEKMNPTSLVEIQTYYRFYVARVKALTLQKRDLESKIAQAIPDFVTPDSVTLLKLQQEILQLKKIIRFYEKALANPDLTPAELEELRIRVEVEVGDEWQQEVRATLDLQEKEEVEEFRTRLRPIFTALLVVLSLETAPKEQQSDLQEAAKVIGQIRQGRLIQEIERVLSEVLLPWNAKAQLSIQLPQCLSALDTSQINESAKAIKAKRGDETARVHLVTILLALDNLESRHETCESLLLKIRSLTQEVEELETIWEHIQQGRFYQTAAQAADRTCLALETKLSTLRLHAQELELAFRQQQIIRSNASNPQTGLVPVPASSELQKIPSDLQVGQMLERLVPKLAEFIKTYWFYYQHNLIGGKEYTLDPICPANATEKIVIEEKSDDSISFMFKLYSNSSKHIYFNFCTPTEIYLGDEVLNWTFQWNPCDYQASGATVKERGEYFSHSTLFAVYQLFRANVQEYFGINLSQFEEWK